MKKRILSVLGALILTVGLLAGCAETKEEPAAAADQTAEQTETVELDETFIDRIIERGYLIVGCKMDVPELSCYDETRNVWSGLEVELAYKTAAALFDVTEKKAKEEHLVLFVGVTVADREQKLLDGEIDCMMATFTITKARQENYKFSKIYYTDHVGLMVRNSGAEDDINSLGSGDIESIADLDGKFIGIAKNSTTRSAMLEYLRTNSVAVDPIFCEFDGYEYMYQALVNGNIDCMSVDVSILEGYHDEYTEILNDRISSQNYGAAVLPANARLLNYINKAIESE